jgi:hypothetical protein
MNPVDLWHSLPQTRWNVLKYNPLPYTEFISVPFLQGRTSKDVERTLSGQCMWQRAKGITKQLLFLSAEKLGMDETRLETLGTFKGAAIVKSYFHTLFPVSSPLAAVSARFITAKEALIAGIDAHDSLEALPLELCEEFVLALEAHIETFGPEPPEDSHEFRAEKALRTITNVLANRNSLLHFDYPPMSAENKAEFQAKCTDMLAQVGPMLADAGKAEEFEHLVWLHADE